MKKLILAFVLVFCAAPALAEDYTMTTYYPAPNGVYNKLSAATSIGVGTTAPLTQLHVIGRAFIDNSGAAHALANNDALTVDGAGGVGNGMLTLRDNSANTRLTVDSTNGFRTYTGLGAETARITPAGNVGIGNNSPIGPLAVGNSAVDGSDGYIVIGKRAGGGTRHFRVGFDPSFKFTIGDYGNMNTVGAWVSAFNMDWNTPANTLVLNSSGYVGIGLAAPATLLDVGGLIQSSAGGHFKNWPNGGTGPGAEIGTSGGEGYVLAYDRTANAYVNLNLQSNAGLIKMYTNGKINVTTTGFGIGVAAPNEQLEVAGNVKVAGAGILNSSSSQIIETNKTDWLRINQAQSYTSGIAMYQGVAIGTGSLKVGNWVLPAGVGNIVATNDITAGNDVYATNTSWAQQFWHWSDERLKENITPVTNALEKVQALNGVYYNFKGKTKKQVGLIAQDVEKVVPEVVGTAPNGMKALDYSDLVAVLIEAVKEQQTKIDALEKELKAQRSDLETLKRAHQ